MQEESARNGKYHSVIREGNIILTAEGARVWVAPLGVDSRPDEKAITQKRLRVLRNYLKTLGD